MKRKMTKSVKNQNLPSNTDEKSNLLDSNSQSTTTTTNFRTDLNPIWYKKWSVFARNGTLLDDLSFSFYFHSTLANQLLHFCTIMLIYICLAICLAYVYTIDRVPLVSILFFVVYGSVFLLLEWRVGIIFMMWFAMTIVIASQVYQYENMLYISLISIAGTRKSEFDLWFFIKYQHFALNVYSIITFSRIRSYCF
jgi:hypothetical protein